ncbi:hypothetical protein EYF80_042305 [Liparis tanakae]|uniref:Uncharacterized protein n=1 Tax=Liparis tanakae TaxID=230148 RepID=A0A4Z2G3N7_9TELE|nr:hypothetical protein EYF80_042305 [Liparis tanakae]
MSRGERFMFPCCTLWLHSGAEGLKATRPSSCHSTTIIIIIIIIILPNTTYTERCAPPFDSSGRGQEVRRPLPSHRPGGAVSFVKWLL